MQAQMQVQMPAAIEFSSRVDAYVAAIAFGENEVRIGNAGGFDIQPATETGFRNCFKRKNGMEEMPGVALCFDLPKFSNLH